MAGDRGAQRDCVAVAEAPDGLGYSTLDEDGQRAATDSSIIGAKAQAAAAKFPWFTLALAVGSLASALAFYLLPWGAALAFSLPTAVALVILYNRQRLAKSVAIVYAMDSALLQQRAAALDAMLLKLSASRSTWIMLNVQRVFDPRLAAGSGISVRRMPIRPWKGSPIPIESNLGVWSLDGPTARVVFLPDQLLVVADGHAAAFLYSELRANFTQAEFVETEFALPPDATVTGWRAIHNKADGTPDRRFTTQQQWPACAYSHLQLMAPNGVTMEIIASRADVAAEWHAHWNMLQTSVGGGLRGYVSAPAVDPATSYGQSAYAPQPAPAMGSPLAGLPPPPVIPPMAAQTFNAAPQPSSNAGAAPIGWALYSQTTATDRASAVALLRFIAVADRRFTDDERLFILRSTVELFGVSDAEAVQILDSAPTNEAEIESCAQTVYARGPMLIAPLVAKLDQLPQIDGKATPNELTRLALVRRWLGY